MAIRELQDRIDLCIYVEKFYRFILCITLHKKNSIVIRVVLFITL